MAEEKQRPEEEFLPEPYPLSAEDRAAALAKAKAQFTAADLQRFTEVEDGIPMEEVISVLEAVQRKASQDCK